MKREGFNRAALLAATALLVADAVFLLLYLPNREDLSGPLVRLPVVAIPVLLFLVLIFLFRWIGELRQSRKPPAEQLWRQDGLAPAKLRAAKGSPAVIEERIRALDESALLEAYNNPSQNADVRAVIAGELNRRGRTAADMDAWMPAADQVSLRSAIAGRRGHTLYRVMSAIRGHLMDLTRLLCIAGLVWLMLGLAFKALGVLGIRLGSDQRWLLLGVSLWLSLPFHNWQRFGPGAVVAVAGIGAALSAWPWPAAWQPLLYALSYDRYVVLAVFAFLIARGWQGNSWALVDVVTDAAMTALILFLGLGYFFTGLIKLGGGGELWWTAAYLLGSGLLCAFAASLVSGGARARILLLRPFGEASMTAALKGVVRRYLGNAGNVFTLSDRNYRPSTTMQLLEFFGQLRHLVAPLVRPSLQVAAVTTPGGYRLLQGALKSGFPADFKNAYSGGQAFNVASSDSWWKQCIDLMMHSCDFVVMDISRVSTGSAWEVAQLARRGLLERCIFIVQEDYAEGALASIAPLLPAGAAAKVHVFKRSGEFFDEIGAMSEIDAAIARAVAARA